MDHEDLQELLTLLKATHKRLKFIEEKLTRVETKVHLIGQELEVDFTNRYEYQNQ